eukprot:GEMP01068704.1.p1 GENE.GEMP01068704.1~~GEMP01068704.1.p1  ORF type:complete len:216 (+),score=39.33 GEMP01068704.1:41-649(+)
MRVWHFAIVLHALPVQWIRQLGQFLQNNLGAQFGVVLGVGPDAKFPLEMLEAWPPGVLFLVDPFIHIAKGYDHPDNVDDKTHQLNFERLRQVFETSNHQGRFSLAREFSFSFARMWREGKLESQGRQPAFVYLDANLSPEAMRQDLRDWWPMIMAPGVIAGSNWSIVEPVVREFFQPTGLEVYVGDEVDASWMVVKHGVAAT